MREADNTGVLLLGWRLVSPPFFLIMKRRSEMKTTSGGRHRSPLTRIATPAHAFTFSRRISPELCFVAPPSKPRGRREGRVPAGTRGPLREKHTQENRTAAYRCSQSLGLPCAMFGRLMPCSPGSRVPSGLPRLANWMMLSARLGSHTPPRKLDRSNDGQDHTVLPYAHSPFRRRVRPPRARGDRNTDETNLTAPLVRTWPRAHRDYPPCPHLSCRRCRVHRKPGSQSRRQRDRPSRMSRDDRHIRRFRISVKWNIFTGRD